MKHFTFTFLVLLPVCAFAQFTETFDGPDIHTGNLWKGQLEKFSINHDGWLQLNAPEEAGKASLNCTIPYAPTMQWEFDVRIDGIPTDNNFIRFYLYLESDETYYYVQIGHNGNKKISLRTSGKRELFERRESGFTEAPLLLHIKVTLEENTVWSLYSRKAEDSCYRLEGMGSYPIQRPQEQGALALTIGHTKTRNRHFAIDNIHVTTEITPTDTIPDEPDPEEPLPEIDLPTLLSMEPLTLSTLRFTFDLPVEKEHAVFAISDIGYANQISYTDGTKAVLDATFPQALIPGVYYTISYSGLTDPDGNAMESFSEEVMLEESKEEGTSPLAGSVVINEVMADPKGLTALPETEYVELHNASEQTVQLSHWLFAYGGNPKPMTAFTLAPDGYAVLYRAGRDIETGPAAIKVPLENFPSALANTGKQLQLFDATGALIHEVTYEKATPGKSWEHSSAGWQLSSDPRGGTPGSANSSEEEKAPEEPDTPKEPPVSEEITVVPNAFVFNELLPNPLTGGSEYIELYNRSNRALPLSGLSLAIRKTDGTLSTHYPLSSITTTIEPGGYALLTKSQTGVTDFYSILSPSALFEIPKLPILANTSSTLVLFRSQQEEVIIDEVSYSSQWHAFSVKDQKGIALERLHPEKPTQSAYNWTSASMTSGHGTPGYLNSQSEVSQPDKPDQPTGIEVPVWKEDRDLYTISYYLDQPGYTCRIVVFNLAGQRVAELANHQLMGLTGILTWDGLGFSGKRLKTGVYIFYAALYHSNGRMKTYKKVFLMK